MSAAASKQRPSIDDRIATCTDPAARRQLVRLRKLINATTIRLLAMQAEQSTLLSKHAPLPQPAGHCDDEHSAPEGPAGAHVLVLGEHAAGLLGELTAEELLGLHAPPPADDVDVRTNDQVLLAIELRRRYRRLNQFERLSPVEAVQEQRSVALVEMKHDGQRGWGDHEE